MGARIPLIEHFEKKEWKCCKTTKLVLFFNDGIWLKESSKNTQNVKNIDGHKNESIYLDYNQSDDNRLMPSCRIFSQKK
jgi:hypothetical protein